MVRKSIGALMALAVFFGFTMSVAASPISSGGGAQSMYASAAALPGEDPSPQFIPAVVKAAVVVAKTPFVQNVAAGVVSGLVVAAVAGSSEMQASPLDAGADVLFN